MSSPISSPSSLPWEQTGWLDTVAAWVDDALPTCGRQRLAPLVPFKPAWVGSAVLTTSTDGGRVFFKATAGVPSEALVLANLCTRHPQGLPTLLAVDLDRGWQLTHDFGGAIPATPADHMRVLSQLAALQRAECAAVDAWRALGCPHRPTTWLTSQRDRLLGTLPATFARHGLLPSAHARALDDAIPAAAAVGQRLDAVLPMLSLHQEDCRPGNTVVRERDVVIFDWADAVVAHPFFSAQRYLDDVDAAGGHPADWVFATDDPRARLRDAYLSPWREAIVADTLEEAFTLTRLLEPLYQLARYDARMDLDTLAAAGPSDEDRALATAVWRSVIHVLPGWFQVAQATGLSAPR